MKVKRTLTIEIERVRITTNFNHNKHLWCEICRTETEFITKDETAKLFKAINAQGLSVKKDSLHFFGTDKTQLMVCLNSIVNGSINLKIY